MLGTIYLLLAFRFWQNRDDIRRRMLWASFLYLPAILILLLFTNV